MFSTWLGLAARTGPWMVYKLVRVAAVQCVWSVT
jgi:hypothetical protein